MNALTSPKNVEKSEQRRDSTSSIDASTFTHHEKSGVSEQFLASLAHTEQPARELTIIAMSHAESMGLIFPNWVRVCYNRGPIDYEPYDMNMPPVLIPRKALHYKFDPPLTERGQIVAETFGRGLASAGINPFEVYCSPDMKSIQTAACLIKGLGTSYPTINIEPALMGYRQMFPHNYQEMLLSPKVFFGLGYPINTQYMPHQGFFGSETIEDYNVRVQSFFRDRIAKIEQKSVIVIADNVMVEMTQNGRIETVDDILKCTKRATCQMSTLTTKTGEAKPIDSPSLPFTRTLYATRPNLWHDVPSKLSVPNHPEL